MAKNRLVFIAIFIISSAASFALGDEKLTVGSLVLQPEITFDYYVHKLGDNWTPSRVGYKNIDYNYAYNASSPTTNGWKGLSQETLTLDMGLKPAKNLSIDAGFRVIGEYADQYWQPINLEHRMAADGKYVNWDVANIKYDMFDSVGLQYQRGVGHGGWQYQGDLFNLYPEQYDTDTYLRVAGYAIPEMYSANVNAQRYGRLQLIYAPEAIWDYKNGVYANYSLSVLKQKLHLIYRNDVIPYGNPGERMESSEISSAFSFLGQSVDLGALYRPFRVGWNYQYVDQTKLGSGIGGSAYIPRTGITNQTDALGGSAKLNFQKNIVFDMLSMQYTYLGLVAGDKNEIKSHINRKITKETSLGFDYTYRKPLLGPVPLVYQNVNGTVGPALLSPRGPESPFWVGWGDPGSGSNTGNNREASIFSAIFTFNPTPDTWFYRNEPDDISDYNLNPREKAFYSFAAVYTLTNYPTGTDRLIYKDDQNNVVWDPANTTGAWPTDGNISEFTIINRFNFGKTFKMNLKLGAGDSLATNSSAYTNSTSVAKAVTNYFISKLTLEKNPYKITIEYDKDYWGPEIWEHQFGETFDRLYRCDISREMGSDITVGIGYVGARKNNYTYLPPAIPGDFDEFHTFISMKLGPIKADFKQKSGEGQLYGIIPNIDLTPPQVSISVTKDSFSPGTIGGEDFVGIMPYAMDSAGIYEWKITIRNSKGVIVKTYSGQGQPPSKIDWNGKDDNDLNVMQDNYKIDLQATDGTGNSAATESVEVYLIRDLNSKKSN